MNAPGGRKGGIYYTDRAIFNNPQFRGAADIYAAIWLIAHAAWDSVTVFVKTGKATRLPVNLERGQLCYSMRFLSTKWEYSLATVQRRITYFVSTGFISISPPKCETGSGTGYETGYETGPMIITICNYDKYQSFCPIDETGIETGIETGSETKKKSIEKKSIKKNIYTASFETFWALVPADAKKQGKGSIVKHYTAAEKEVGGDLLASKYAEYLKSTQSDEKFRMWPRRWLSERHWEDEPIAAAYKPFQPI